MPSLASPSDSKPAANIDNNFLTSLVSPTLSVGLGTGIVGAVGGGIYGLFRAQRSGPFAAAVAAQSFYYGASIYFFRSALLAAIPDHETRSARLFASGGAGVASGLIASTWQRAPPARTTAMLGLFSLATQVTYDFWYLRDARRTEKKPFLERISDSAWMPLKSLPDHEYEDILQRRIDKLEAEISSVESQLGALQRQKAQLSSRSP